MDHLEDGIQRAVTLMAGVPDNSELSIARVDDQLTWLGFGYMVAKGWVAYRGEDCFKWRDGGREPALAYATDH